MGVVCVGVMVHFLLFKYILHTNRSLIASLPDDFISSIVIIIDLLAIIWNFVVKLRFKAG